MSEITIASTADYPHLIPLLGRWYWEEWGPFEPERSLASWIAMLAPRTLRDEIPTIYVALAAGPLPRTEETPVGTASLIAADMSTHPELSPWLAGVYVVPEYRRQGIGRALVHRVMSTAAALSVPRLYLFTDSKQRWYANLGWVEIGREPYQGLEVAIMCFVCE
jgi:GNAT superfamily N-acetyltransferase